MLQKSSQISSIFLLSLFFMLNVSGVLKGQESSPPSKPIEILYQNLLGIMKKSKELGINGRFDKLSPVLQNTYDVSSMAKNSVGRIWDTLPTTQKNEIISEFSRMMIATYANRFNGYDGEYFEINETLDQPPSDKIVKTRIVPKIGKPVELNYILRNDQGRWKVIDVYLDGTISEIATRRAEFSGILKSTGPDGLVASLRQQGDKLMSSQ